MSAPELEAVNKLLFIAVVHNSVAPVGRISPELARPLCAYRAPLGESDGHLPTVFRAFIRDKGHELKPEDLALCNELLAELSL